MTSNYCFCCPRNVSEARAKRGRCDTIESSPRSQRFASLVHQKVEIRNVKSKPELNGKKGVILEFADERYTIQYAASGHVKLKPDNVTIG